MFSERLWKILGFRLNVMEYCCSAPVKWDGERKRLCPPSNYSYWNFGMYHFYVSFAACYISSKLIIKHTTRLEKLFADVEDEAVIVEDPLQPFLTALDLIFVTIFVVVSGIQFLFRNWKAEFIIFFNELVDVDEAMEEIFKLQINSNPSYKMTVAITESLMLLTSVMSLIFPVLFGVFFLQKLEPCHRVVEEILEIHPGLNWETVPIILVIMWSVLQCTNSVILIIIVGCLYIKFYSFWITSLQPTALVQEHGRRGTGSKYLTPLGYVKGEDMIRLYRIHQVLNRMCNQFLGKRLVSFHQVAILIVTVSSCFICIKHLEMIVMTPGYQVGFLAIGLTVLVEYLETKMISEAASSSNVLKRKVRNLTGRTDVIAKAIGRTWDLRVDVAYPYFKLGRHTFLEFMQASVGFITDALVAAEQRTKYRNEM